MQPLDASAPQEMYPFPRQQLPNILFLTRYRGCFADSLNRLIYLFKDIRKDQVNTIRCAGILEDSPSIPDGRPYSLIIPFNTPNADDTEFYRCITPRIAKDINRGICRIFFDNSNELCHESVANNLVNGVLERGILNTSSVYLICQDRLLGSKTPIRVLNHDYFIIRSWDTIKRLDLQGYYQRFDQGKTLSRSHTFLCLNATPRLLRVCTLIKLITLGLWGEGTESSRFLVSFPGLLYAKHSGLDAADIKKVFQCMDLSLINHALEWITLNSPFVIDESGATGNDLVDIVPIEAYRETLASLVTETECFHGIQRITEKTYKALALGHLPIIIGNPGSIELVKMMGFDTFEQLVDHSYDKLSSLSQRIDESIKAATNFHVSLETTPAIIDEYKLIARKNMEWAISGFAEKYITDYTCKILDAVCHLTK